MYKPSEWQFPSGKDVSSNVLRIQSRASCRFEDAMKQQDKLTHLEQEFVLHELPY